ncbi:marginal zone B- and B1-cell-specific protein-like [Acanthaster planci]|uniref:Marginal zone B- and B1-cell-specific protein-like n=1 Tax=Acanthaster planci TaxID=133434 RepID=A0A8B7XKP8_ACAPL|nr:marginal zone B- and B1-cell-specific protein-like [Acanthaster planci]
MSKRPLPWEWVVVTFAVLVSGLVALVLAGGGMKFEPDPDAEVYDSGFASSGKMSFTTPDLDDEDHHSLHMPDQLLCDACQIVAHMLETKFDKMNEKRPSLKKNLYESDILDAVDEVCSDEFSSVGIKEIKGVKRLAGPGLSTKDVPGIMQGGGKWPGRMREVCTQYAGDLEEENIYNAYKEKELQKFLCYDEGRHCAKVAKNKDGKKTKKERKVEL